MSINAGEVKATFTGDASGLQAASEKARKALSATGDEAKAAGSKLAAADAQSKALAATLSTTSAAATASSNQLGKVREGLEKVRGVMGAFGQATGVATAQLGAFGGIAGNALGAFMTGGGLAVGLSVVASGLAFAADKFDLFGKKAEEAAKKSAGHFADLKKEIADLDAALLAMATGTTIEVVKQKAIVAEKDLSSRSAVEAFGGADRYARFLGYQAAGTELPREIEQGLDEATRALKEYSAEQQKLTALIRNSQFAQHLKDEADATAAAKAAKLRASTAENKLAGELEKSLQKPIQRALILDPGGPTSTGGMKPSVHATTIGSSESIGDKIGAAFGKKGSDVIGRALGGDLGGALSAAAGIAGAAAGIPFAGQLASAFIESAQKAVEIIVTGLAHVGEMIGRPFAAMLSKGGTGRFGGMLGQLGGDMKAALKTQTDAILPSILLGPLGGILNGGAQGVSSMQRDAAMASFAFSLVSANKAFDKFTDVIGQAGTVLLEAFGPIWERLLPIAGAFAQIGEAFAPVIDAFIAMIPLEPIMTIVIEAMKQFGIALAAVGIVSTMFARGITTLLYKMKLIDSEDFSERIKGLAEVMTAFQEAQTAIADITVGSAQRAATAAEREAAKQLAIERAKEKAGMRAAEALERVTEGAENLPAGYRTDGAEYRSMSGRASSSSTNNIVQVQSMTINWQGDEGGRTIGTIAERVGRRAWSASQYASMGRLSVFDRRN